MAIAPHPFDLQIFDRDQIELPHQLKTHFVKEVEPLTRDLLMFPRQLLHGFAPTAAFSVRPSRDPTLRRLEFSLGASQKPGILDPFSGR